MPHDKLLDAARELAKSITRHSPLTSAAIITAVTRGINLPIAEGLLMEAEQFARVTPTNDVKEGLEAWMHRRRAQFTGQ